MFCKNILYNILNKLKYNLHISKNETNITKVSKKQSFKLDTNIYFKLQYFTNLTSFRETNNSGIIFRR